MKPKPACPPDYEARVYAGVLGKLIGVYAGRPFEQWSHDGIVARWGEIRRYVNEDQKVPLVVADDDITGTFTFIRALPDHGISPDLTARQIGQTWLNYIAEGRHILWWSGLGMSTEHTAWLRLAAGVDAPFSGSIELNGLAVAEEIGAQIFIDGWAMVAPGNPELAVKLAREAARVSHDGEAVYGASAIAALESLAFVESDLDVLLDCAMACLPRDCMVVEVTTKLRQWHRKEPDWRITRQRFVDEYGYERFKTNCPLISNYGIIILALLYGAGDFDRSMMIVNTCGYDTDCNAGNLGCLLGLRNGLGTFRSGYDWRTPVNDRMYLPAADGHWGLMDAANMAMEIARIGRALAGEKPVIPKGGARYHFSLPGSTHGFAPSDTSPLETQITPIEREDGENFLQLKVEFAGRSCSAEVATFLAPSALQTQGYAISATPALYSGQTLRAQVAGAFDNHHSVRARLFIRAYREKEENVRHEGDWMNLAPGAGALLNWTVPATDGWPICAVGVEVAGETGDRLDLDWLTWDGTPTLKFELPAATAGRQAWEKMFVGSMDQTYWGWFTTFNLIQNRGCGILHTGSRAWLDYRVSARVKPCLAKSCGILGRVQGLTRYYGLLLRPGNEVALVRMMHDEHILAKNSFPWELRRDYFLELEIRGRQLTGLIDGVRILDAEDAQPGLEGGGIGFALEEGRLEASDLRITAL